jgi:hypothetical protein
MVIVASDRQGKCGFVIYDGRKARQLVAANLAGAALLVFCHHAGRPLTILGALRMRSTPLR